MRDEDVACIVVVLLGITMSVVLGITLTQDDTRINLSAISEMTSKCSTNGGLDYIEHDYDVICKNGARFESDRMKSK